MKTKREVFEAWVTQGNCRNIKCEDCPYSPDNNPDNCKLNVGDKLAQIGAMAILRMFRKKKKTITKIRN